MHSFALRATQLATARYATIRLKLQKIGAVIIQNTRRVLFTFKFISHAHAASIFSGQQAVADSLRLKKSRHGAVINKLAQNKCAQ